LEFLVVVGEGFVFDLGGDFVAVFAEEFGAD
jgi:hypothetical protein